MEMVTPSRDRNSPLSYSRDEDSAGRSVDALDRIEEGDEQQLAGSKRGAKESPRRPVAWPFHRSTTSNVTSIAIPSTFRRATWQPKSFLALGGSDTASLASNVKSLVPDYVVNYLRGETPETLAKKKERSKWGQRSVNITPQRDTIYSRTADFDDVFSSDAKLNPDGYANEGRQRGSKRFLFGWRGGIVFNSLAGLLVLLASIICLIIVATRSSLLAEDLTFYTGSCTTVSNIDAGVHGTINVLAVVLLAGGNYAFHVLSSPTRMELAKAHSKKRWLDIGIPSLRNFEDISWARSSLALLILLVVLATQVIFNAVIFTSHTALNYEVLFVSEPFLSGAQFSDASENNVGGLSRLDITAIQQAAVQKQLVNFTTADCMKQFDGAYDTAFDAVLLVTNLGSELTSSTSLVQTGKTASLKTYSKTASSSAEGAISLDSSSVQYCLARKVSDDSPVCSASVSAGLLGLVVLLNLVFLGTVPLFVLQPTFEPLVTLGDAIRSFLRNPDPTTGRGCLLTKQDVLDGRWGLNEPKYFAPKNHFWYQTPSTLRWILTAGSWLAITVPVAIALALIIGQDPADALTPFGSSPYTTFEFPTSATIVEMAVLASAPQLLLGILYLATNSMLTTYYLSHELSQFATRHQPLRVSSDPVGAQTTSLFLTLPRPLSWLLLALFAVLGVILSQAVFPATLVLSSSDASGTYTHRLVAVSLSTTALLTLLVLLVLLAALVLGLGLRRAPPARDQVRGNPLALSGGSCSAVVSAACHPPPGEAEPWRRWVGWGVVYEGLGMEVGHCSFSAEPVGGVDIARSYI